MVNNNTLPEGMDMGYGENTREENAVINYIYKKAHNYAFDTINPLLIDYLENVDIKNDITTANSLFKCVDSDGKVLAVNNDMTPSIAKSLALNYKGAPLRVFHNEKVYSFKPYNDNKREKADIGMDIFGINSVESDGEMIAFAEELIKGISFSNYKLIINHTGIMRGVAESYRVHNISQRDLKEIVCGGILLDVPKDCSDAIFALSRLKGGVEIIQQAGDIVKNAMSVDSLLNLFELCQLLNQYGITYEINLGYICESKYYNGVSYRFVDVEDGESLWEGGRYNVNVNGSVVGDASLKVNLNKFAQVARAKQRSLFALDGVDVLLGCANSLTAFCKGLAVRSKLVETGLNVETVYRVTHEQIMALATAKDVTECVYIDENGGIKNN